MSNIFIDKGRLLVDFDEDTRNIINTIRDVDGILITEDERMYVHHIVSGLKAIGVWSKIKALYGFVGGTAATHKWNWKDMRDLDAAYRLSFLGGGWVHNSTGAKANGTTSYGDTFLSPLIHLLDYNLHLSFYKTIAPTKTGIDLRAGSIIQISLSPNSNATPASSLAGGTNGVLTFPRTASKGIFIGSRTSSSNHIAIINNTIYSGGITNVNVQRVNYNLYLGAQNADGVGIDYIDSGYGMLSIGDGLTQQEAIQMSHIITTAQGILGRK